MSRILVVVDMQNDFVTGVLGTKEAQGIIPAVRAKIADYRESKDQVIFTRDTHDAGYMDSQEGKRLPVPHCIANTEGWQLIPEMIAIFDIDDDIVINKPTFGGIDLIDEISFIEESVGEIDSIEFIGVCTGICVIANAVLAKTHFTETQILVDANACACVSPASHKTALETMKLLQIDVI